MLPWIGDIILHLPEIRMASPIAGQYLCVSVLALNEISNVTHKTNGDADKYMVSKLFVVI